MIRNYRNAEADEQNLSYVKFPKTIPFCFTYNDKEYKGFKDLTLIDTNTEKRIRQSRRNLYILFQANLKFASY